MSFVIHINGLESTSFKITVLSYCDSRYESHQLWLLRSMSAWLLRAHAQHRHRPRSSDHLCRAMIASLHGVDKTYRLGKVELPALRDVTVGIRPDCFTVIAGPSGSGKSTLLNLLGGIDRPDRGEVSIRGQRLSLLSDDALSDFRSTNIGFVFQNFNLLPVLSAYENVEYPLILARADAATRRRATTHLLEQVGLADKARHLPNELSGGQRQRVAIARALIGRPQLVLADEPTANLDSHTGDSILALMRRMQQEHRVSFVFSSHDPRLIDAADDVIEVRDGRIATVRRHCQTASQPYAEALS